MKVCGICDSFHESMWSQDVRSDWAWNAKYMGKLYENALFTIAAVSSRDSSVPFLGPDAPSMRDHWNTVDVDARDLEVSTSHLKA